jgi:hypothetical protein
MLELTLDLQVFMSGAGTGDPAHHEDSRAMMISMQDASATALVLDEEGLLMSEYDKRAKQGFGKQWIIQMLTKGKISRVARTPLDKGTRAALDEQKFKGEDRDLISRTAAGSDSGLLVAHEAHFHAAKVKKILKNRLGVSVITARQASEQIAGLPED